MAAPTPTSTTVGQILTSAFWNTEVDAALNFILNPPLFIARCTTGDTWSGSAHVTGPTALVATSSANFVWFDTEDRDPDGMHSTATRADVITINTAGVWEVMCIGSFALNAAATSRIIQPIITPFGGSAAALAQSSLVVPGNTSNSGAAAAFFSYPFGVGDTLQFSPESWTAVNFTGCRVQMRWTSK